MRSTRIPRWARRALPWLVSLTACAVLLWPFRDQAGRAALADAVLRASPWTLLVAAVNGLIMWLTDTFTTALTFRRFGTRVGWREAGLVCGSSLLFDAISPALGQAAIGVFMNRRGCPLARTVQVVLVMNITFMSEMIFVSGLGLALGHEELPGVSIAVVTLSLAGVVTYLAVIGLRPAWLARRPALTQLFDVGLGGHLYAFLVRAPNMFFAYAGQIAFLHAFGIHVPLAIALLYLPAVVFITGLPISVQGLGPAQLAQLALFSPYVAGPSRVARATILAWGIGSTVLAGLASLVIGLLCLSTMAGREARAAVERGAA